MNNRPVTSTHNTYKQTNHESHYTQHSLVSFCATHWTHTNIGKISIQYNFMYIKNFDFDKGALYRLEMHAATPQHIYNDIACCHTTA